MNSTVASPSGRKRKTTVNCESNGTKVHIMSSLPQQKTTISALQEICQQKNQPMPIYKELESSNPKSFRMQCDALGYSAYGEGPQKKSAKHQAAEKLLKLYLPRGVVGSDDMDVDDDDSGLETSSDFVSELLQFCIDHQYPKPKYDCINQTGPSHAPEFTIRCSVRDVTTKVTVKNKKMGNQVSAKEMLEGLRLARPETDRTVNLPKADNIKESTRFKAKTYLELKKMGKIDELGCCIKDRHDYYIKNIDGEVLTKLREILAQPVSEGVFRELKQELEKFYDVKHEQFLDTELYKFEVIVPNEVFTCLLVDEKKELEMQVLEYFKDMLAGQSNVHRECNKFIDAVVIN